jgi:hypothetical protein
MTVLCNQIVAALATLNFETVLQTTLPVIDEQTAWAGRFYASVSMVAGGAQFVLCPAVLRWLPLGWLLAGNGLVQLVASAFVLTFSGLGSAAGFYMSI